MSQDGSDYGGNVVLRVARLPLVSSSLQSVTSAYSGVKGRFPLLGMVGDLAEVGVRAASLAALSQVTPLLQSLNPQIEAANDYACFGLDQLEKNFPVLHQSSDEVLGHLKDALLLTVDDVAGRTVERVEALSELLRLQLRALQDSPLGRAAYSGLDEVLSQLEDASAYYLPLPPTMRREWERRVQEYEEQDEGEEPGLWTRFRGLLLRISLQVYHRLLKQREALDAVAQGLKDRATRVGLGRVVDMMGLQLRQLQLFLRALVLQAGALRGLALTQVRAQAGLLAELDLVGQLRGLPLKATEVLVDLQELTMVLLQFLINSSPLYAMLQQPSDQEVEDFLNQERFTTQIAPRRDSTDSLFLKAMDCRPRRRKSLYSRARLGSGGVAGPQMVNGGGPEPGKCPPGAPQRRPSATELLLSPLLQFVSQSQKAFDYLSPSSPADQDMAGPLLPEAGGARVAEEEELKEEVEEVCPPATSQRRPSTIEVLLSPLLHYLSPALPAEQDKEEEEEELEEARGAEKEELEEEVEEEDEAARVGEEEEVEELEEEDEGARVAEEEEEAGD